MTYFEFFGYELFGMCDKIISMNRRLLTAAAGKPPDRAKVAEMMQQYDLTPAMF